jgi:mannan endo-1,4-beta-mannosidase
MPKGDPPYSWGFAGKPILILDRKFEPQEKIFDSGFHRGVALQMDGVIKFPTPGEYGIMALSNDGIRVYIGGKRVINDPDWHGDKYSRKNKMVLTESGWYPFKLKYFQRRGTAALKLFWKTPKDEDFTIIPAEAYGHLPK